MFVFGGDSPQRGYNPKVAADLGGWHAGITASFAVIAIRMVEHCPNLGMTHTPTMGGGLFEVRARGATGIGRAWFCTVVGQRIVVPHGFIKKSQAALAAELRIARKRMKEFKALDDEFSALDVLLRARKEAALTQAKVAQHMCIASTSLAHIEG